MNLQPCPQFLQLPPYSELNFPATHKSQELEITFTAEPGKQGSHSSKVGEFVYPLGQAMQSEVSVLEYTPHTFRYFPVEQAVQNPLASAAPTPQKSFCICYFNLISFDLILIYAN